MFCVLKRKKIYLSYVSNHNSNYEKEFFLIIRYGEGWYYIEIKNLSVLLRAITTKDHVDIYCFNCLHALQHKTNMNLIKKYVKTKIFVCLLNALKY